MNIKALTRSGGAKKTDAVVLGMFEEDAGVLKRSAVLSPQETGAIRVFCKQKKFKGHAKTSIVVPSGTPGPACPVMVMGLGKRSAYRAELARISASQSGVRAKADRWETLRLDAGSFMDTPWDDYIVQSLSEGLLLSAYSFDVYRKKPAEEDKAGLRLVELVIPDKKYLTDAAGEVRKARILCEGVCMTRDLGNEPPNRLYPAAYASRLRAMALSAGVRCRIFDEKRLKALKMGGILGVGMGSERKPRFVILEYRPKSFRNKKPLVFVGKGVTFDSGGISIKPSKDMDEMKFDMCGSAAVAGTLWTAAKLKLPYHVIGLLPLVENMPGGGSQRPGDIIRCHNGKTVEVLNTDAEGRLILADALAYAKVFKPLCVVDIATLTGACANTLDYVASGVMGTDAGVVECLRKAGERTGERLWEFPLWEEYGEFIKGTWADIRNTSRRTAGIQTSAMFLKHFGDHAPWAHLDIAGTAWTTTPRAYNPVGATGIGVRLFIEFIQTYKP